MEVKRGEEVKRRALNLIKKIKFRKGSERRETKVKDEDPDIDITIEEIRRRIREEKEAVAAGAQENPRLEESTEAVAGGAQENSRLEESTDSEFTITYEGVEGSPQQESEEEGVRFNLDLVVDSAAAGRGNDEEEVSRGPATRLSPRQRLRRQSLARFRKKQWGDEWIV